LESTCSIGKTACLTGTERFGRLMGALAATRWHTRQISNNIEEPV
jgi:hypothetical protein